MTTVPIDPRIRARRVEVLRHEGRRRLRWMVALVAAASCLATGWWIVTDSPLLDVDAVRVDGANRTPIDAVIDASGIQKGQALVEVDTKVAKANIAELPWIQDVRADRSLAGAVTFAVTEREPVAAMPGAEGWLIVDADGRVLEERGTVDPGLVLVDGRRWHVRPGGWVSEQALPALDAASLLPSGLRSKVAAINDTEDGLSLVLFGGGRVILGDTTDLDDKFLSALTMVVRVDLTCLDHVDVRAPAVPVLTRREGCS